MKYHAVLVSHLSLLPSLCAVSPFFSALLPIARSWWQWKSRSCVVVDAYEVQVDRQRCQGFVEDLENWARSSSAFALPPIAMDDEQAVRVDAACWAERSLAVTVGSQEPDLLRDEVHHLLRCS